MGEGGRCYPSLKNGCDSTSQSPASLANELVPQGGIFQRPFVPYNQMISWARHVGDV